MGLKVNLDKFSLVIASLVLQVGPNDQNCDNGSAADLGSSDDSIIRSGEETNNVNNTGSCGAGVDGTNRAQDTTHKSFIDKRKRHTSVPQTARTQVITH